MCFWSKASNPAYSLEDLSNQVLYAVTEITKYVYKYKYLNPYNISANSPTLGRVTF